MSVFDKDTFLGTSLDEPLATEVATVSEGEYQGIIASAEDIDVISGETDDGKVWARVNFLVTIDSAEEMERLGRSTMPKVRYGNFLDLTPKGKMATGINKNVWLGKLYKAVGMENKTNQPEDLVGKPFMVKVRERVGKDGVKRTEVVRVAPLR